jgi:hypothetical protein
VRGMAAEACREVTRRMLGPKSKPGTASDYMKIIDAYLLDHPDTEEVCLVIRESGRDQKRRRNHENYKFMVADLEKRGLRVHVFLETCSGMLDESLWCDTLRKVGQFARERKAETGKTVPILAYSADRFLRNVHYKNTTPSLLPTRWEYRQLKRLVGDVPLLTWLDPDTPPQTARGLQSKLGQRAKGNKGGRPKKLSRAERKDLLLRRVRQLKHDTGRGCCWIAKQVGVSSKTVWEWLKEVA